MAVFKSCWLASFALWPDMVARGAQHYNRPFRTTAIGLLVVLPGALAGIALVSQGAPFLQILGFIVLGCLFLVGIAGSTGLCLRIGQGLASPVDKDRPWRAVLRGGVVMSFVCLFPIIGWLGVLLWMLASGCGVVILPRVSQSIQSAAAAQPSPPVMAPDEAAQAGS